MTEGDVQKILRDWFRNNGYKVTEDEKWKAGNKVDLLAESENDTWIVEVKGDYDCDTAQYTVNFDTGLGQLLKSITQLDDQTKYAIGIPFSRTERGEKFSYRLILPKYSKSLVFEKLNIHFLLIWDDGSVEVIEPDRVNVFLGEINPNIRREN